MRRLQHTKRAGEDTQNHAAPPGFSPALMMPNPTALRPPERIRIFQPALAAPGPRTIFTAAAWPDDACAEAGLTMHDKKCVIGDQI
jgi:hypothetical protein